jgi:DNA-binding cell septation regulator SpoVG
VIDPALVARLLVLLEGVEGSYTCVCSRRLRVGLSPEIADVIARLRASLQAAVAVAEVTPEEGSRFALVEVD